MDDPASQADGMPGLPRIVFGLTAGTLSGVDVFIGRLARRLTAMGWPVELLLSEHDVPREQYIPLAFPAEVKVERLAVSQRTPWTDRWRAMQVFLEKRAPCIYVANYDWHHACAVPCCSEGVRIVGVLHSDEEAYYRNFARQGPWWDRAITVSRTILSKACSRNPHLADRLSCIPYGVDMAEPVPRTHEGSLRVLYAGRMVHQQKNLGMLKDVILACDPARVSFTLAGDGPARAEVEHALQDRPGVRFAGTLAPDALLRLYAEHDVVILVSSYEGLPMCLLEGMAAGCIPVVPAIASGIPELVEHKRNGLLIDPPVVSGFAAALEGLAGNEPLRKQLSVNAAGTIRDTFGMDRCAAAYDRVFREVEASPTPRKAPRMVPPRDITLGIWKHRIGRLWPFP